MPSDKIVNYGSLGVPFLFFVWPVLIVLVSIYENVPDFSHGYFVPVVSLYILHEKWPDLIRLPKKANVLGVPILLGGIGLIILAYWYDAALDIGGQGTGMLGGLGIWGLIVGGTLLLFGFSRTLFLAFPLAYLFFAIPYPERITALITVPLRELVTTLSTMALQGSGIEVYREGNILHLAHVSLGVEDVCSGIRSLWASLASGVAIGYLTGCRRFRMVIMVIISIVLAIGQNVLRIYLSGILANKWGAIWAKGWRHDTLGIITLTIALLVLLWIGLRLSKEPPVEEEADSTDEEEAVESVLPKLAGWPYRTIIGLLVASALFGTYLKRHYAIRDQALATFDEGRLPLDDFPQSLGRFSCNGRTEMGETLTKQVNDLLRPSEYFHGVFSDGDGPNMTVLLLLWNPLKVNKNNFDSYIHSPDVCFPAAGWKVTGRLESDDSLFDPEHELMKHRLYTRSSDKKLLYFWANLMAGQSKDSNLISVTNRWEEMKRSWKDPLYSLSMYYSVAIYVDVERSVEAAEEDASAIAHLLKKELDAFGLTPLNLSIQNP